MKKFSIVFILVLAALLGLARGVGAQVVEEWEARYNSATNGFDAPAGLGVDEMGNVYVTGRCPGPMNLDDYLTIKYNSIGQQLWTAQYNGPVNFPDAASSLAVDNYGNVYVTGWSYGTSGTNYDIASIKYNSSGQQQWVARYDGPAHGSDAGVALVLDNEGNIFVTGHSYNGAATNQDFVTIKYNPSGQQQWIAYYNGPANGADEACDLVLDGQGNVYVTGVSIGDSSVTNNQDYAIVKYNSAGQQQWAARYDGLGWDFPVQLALDSEGNVYVTGTTFEPGYYQDITTVKYDSFGQQRWVAHFDGPIHRSDFAAGLVVDETGNVYVTGTSESTWEYNCVTIKYNTLGQEIWMVVYNNSPVIGDDAPTAISLDNEGFIYVAGTSEGYYSGIDWETLKYDSSGQLQWAIRYIGDYEDDYLSAMVVSEDGQVYLTGSNNGNNTNRDIVTVKYRQGAVGLDITLIPISPPIVIPANGGSFNFNASAQRTIGPQAPFAVWARIKNPDGSYTNPTLGPVTINPPVGVTVTRQRTQNVPGSWVAGEYTYLGYANTTFGYPAIDSSSFTFTKSTTVDGGATVWEASCTGELFPGEEVRAGQALPLQFGIAGVSPNPFNPTTAISYKLQAPSQVKLTVYDTAGRLVTTLVGFGESDLQQAGMHTVTFDGSRLAAGVYLVRLEAGSEISVEKIVLLK